MPLPACRPPLLATLLVGLALPGAWAQAVPAGPAASAIYSCVDATGRTITSDRPIPACSTKEQRILNRDGSLRSVYPPSMTADERAVKEAQERRAAEARSAQVDAVRRDRNLLARYPSEAAHRKAREAALDAPRSAMKTTEQRQRELAAERQPLLAEAEFYQGKPVPPKLRAQIDANDAASEAQRDAAQQQRDEIERIDRLYDAELARLKLLWAGAVPGSLGVLDAKATAVPVADGAPAKKPAAPR
jgi:hypothetical protein